MLDMITAADCRKRVTAVTDAAGIRHPCGAVLMAGGWQPAVHLHSHVGGKLAFDAAKHCFVPVADSAQPQSVSACAGDLADFTPILPVIGAKAFIDYQNDVTIADIDSRILTSAIAWERSLLALRPMSCSATVRLVTS